MAGFCDSEETTSSKKWYIFSSDLIVELPIRFGQAIENSGHSAPKKIRTINLFHLLHVTCYRTNLDPAKVCWSRHRTLPTFAFPIYFGIAPKWHHKFDSSCCLMNATCQNKFTSPLQSGNVELDLEHVTPCCSRSVLEEVHRLTPSPFFGSGGSSVKWWSLALLVT